MQRRYGKHSQGRGRVEGRPRPPRGIYKLRNAKENAQEDQKPQSQVKVGSSLSAFKESLALLTPRF